MSGAPSKWFGTYYKAVGVKTDRSLNTHSFRHGFMDALRSAGYEDSQFQPLIGHIKATTTAKYGVLQQGTLEMRRAMIEAVSFDL